MKCVRKIGLDIKYSVWRAQCERAWRKVRQTQKCDISFLRYDLPRYRMRRKALDMIGRSNNRKIYTLTFSRLITRYVNNGGINSDRHVSRQKVKIII